MLLGAMLPAATAPPAAACHRMLAFAEDFHELAIAAHGLAGSRWMAHTPWNGDFGDAVFTDPGPGGPFSLSPEGLRITASRDATGYWHSGLIAAGDAEGRGPAVRYGYFEARMKLPPGPGTWPAFWLMSKPGAPKGAPTVPSVEIDVMEYYGHTTATYQAALHVWYHGKDQTRSRHVLQAIPVTAGSLVGRWHDYGVAVGPKAIIWYLDGTEVWRQSTPPELTAQISGPLYPLVDLALGSGYSTRETPNPSLLSLRYVHVWRDGLEGCATGTPMASGGITQPPSPATSRNTSIS